jgi:CheY-like chemotaxis protein
LLAENSVDVVVLDYRVPEMDGFAVATAIRKCYDNIPIVLLSGYPKELLKDLRDCTLGRL